MSLNRTLIGKKQDRSDLMDEDVHSLIGDTPLTQEALHMNRPTDDDLQKQTLKEEREQILHVSQIDPEDELIKQELKKEREQSRYAEGEDETSWQPMPAKATKRNLQDDPVVRNCKAEQADRAKKPIQDQGERCKLSPKRRPDTDDDPRLQPKSYQNTVDVDDLLAKRRPDMGDGSCQQPTRTGPVRNTVNVDDLRTKRRPEAEDDSGWQVRQKPRNHSMQAPEEDRAKRTGRPEEEESSSWQPTRKPSMQEAEEFATPKSRPEGEEEGESSWQPTSRKPEMKLGGTKGLRAQSVENLMKHIPNNGRLPGAYAGAPGEALTRSQRPSYSVLNSTTEAPEFVASLDRMEGGALADKSEKSTHLTRTTGADVNYTNNQSDEGIPGDDHEEFMAVAQPALRPSQLPEAMEVYADAAREAKNNHGKSERAAVALGFLLLVFILVSVSLVVTKGQGVDADPIEAPSLSPSMSPTIMLPPMDNMEVLYWELPDNTRDSLTDATSPQWKAWDWLLHHQNVTNLPEWRKQQLFALATFYHSFEGPKWPEEIRKNWLNETVDECLWIQTNLRYLYGISATYLRSLDFDFNPCNGAGEFTTIALIALRLAGANPIVPPEIALLPHLSHLILALSEIQAPLSNMLPPEIYQLRKLDLFVLHGNALTGTLPNEIGMLTSPRYMLFGINQISGILPTELGLLSPNLLDLDLHESNLIGTIPTELGLLTAATSLDLHGNHLSGSVPTELGLMTMLEEFQFDGNSLTGSIPSEVGLLKRTKRLHLQNTNLSGSIPAELCHLTELRDLNLINLPLLSGTIPDDLCYLQANDTSCFVFEGVGALPGSYECSLEFDCSEFLCGCDCPCFDQNSTFLSDNQTL